MTAVGAAALGVAGRLGERARAPWAGWRSSLPPWPRSLCSLAGTSARGRAGLRLSANDDRLFLWARAAEIALDHPVLGVGFGSYHLVLGPYYDRFNPAFPMRTWAHDMPLSMLCETGPLGLFAFLWLVIEALGLARERWGAPETRQRTCNSARPRAGRRAGHPGLRGRLDLPRRPLRRPGRLQPLLLRLAPRPRWAARPAASACECPARLRCRRLAVSSGPVSNLRELFQYRALVWALTTRELKARYRGSVLGFLWTFLNPLLAHGGLRPGLLGVPAGRTMPHYTYFMFVGLLPWIWFSNSMAAGHDEPERQAGPADAGEVSTAGAPRGHHPLRALQLPAGPAADARTGPAVRGRARTVGAAASRW